MEAFKSSNEIINLRIQKMNNDLEIDALRRDRKELIAKGKRFVNFKTLSDSQELVILNSIIKKISTKLFDEFNWKSIKSEDDIKWKEFFHGLYDLVIINDENMDKTTLLLVLQMVPNWYKILETPKCRLSHKALEILELFGELEHEQVMMAQRSLVGLPERMNECVRTITKLHIEAFRVAREIDKLKKQNEEIKKVLEWSVREYSQVAGAGIGDVSPPGTPDLSD